MSIVRCKQSIVVESDRYIYKTVVEQLKEHLLFSNLVSYWERNNQNEIDIVAIDEIEKKLLICEVKLNEKKINYNNPVSYTTLRAYESS
ncbi:DUF234 domain-containing protein [Halarcobacter bivalviorum]|uniref:DUF234 domain-containing protein n=1 Tax=Halarcobacter bivalviorum TaxID=663364 RepID=UPI0019D6D1D8